MSTIELFAPITKREKDPVTGHITVFGKMTGPDLDLDEQRMDPAWLAKAVPAWFESGANVREMHKTSAVGKGQELTQVGDDWFLKALVVDPDAITKVESEVYTGFSISVRAPRIVKDASAPGGRIVGGMIPETSLVDRPCLSTAKFLLAKSAGGAPEELEPIELAGYCLTKADDTAVMDTEGDVEGEGGAVDEVDLISIARAALNQWLAQEAAEVVDGKGGRFVVRLICSVLEDLDWAEEADIYDDAQAAIDAVKALLTTPAEEADVNLNKIASLTKAATADDATDTDKAAVAELRKALGIDDLDTKITAEVTKAASAEDLEKVALRLAKVETTAMTNGPVRVPALMDAARATARDEAINKAAEYRAKAGAVTDRDTAAAYLQMAREVEATITTTV